MSRPAPMPRTPRRIGLALLLAGAASMALPGPQAQQPVTLVPLTPPPAPLIVDGLEVLPVQGNIHVIVGAGANVTVQTGDEGVLLVDSGGPGQSGRILAAVHRLTGRPVRFLVNTNPDPDHVAGNGAIVMAEGGARGPRPGGAGGGNAQGPNVGVITVAHENAFNRMSAGTGGFAALTGDALPQTTFFTPKKEFFSNGEAVQVLAQPKAHTDGDVIVFFRQSDVVSTGDVFVTTGYPVIDATRGGSVQGVIDGLNAIIDLTVPERNQMGGTRVIPGHGRICNEADVVEYRDMVTIIRDRVQDMAKKGMTLAQMKTARPSLDYDGLYGATTGEWTTEMFLEAIFREVSGRKS
jgi:cyclase